MKDDMKKNVENKELEAVELTDEELEDVAGGGLKEIVAATTLAAMAMTGNTVSAFGLANALAEDQGKSYESFVEGPVGEVSFALGETQQDELVFETEETANEVIDDETEYTVTDAGITLEAEGFVEDTAAPEDNELEAEVMEATEGVVLDEGLTLEGQEAPAEEAIDRAALARDLIGTAMDARQGEGIYAALDDTFETLAQNVDLLADPATGVVEADGDQIVGMTYDALAARFDATPEQLMGAIGAAAARANDRGDLQVLGGDPALVSLAANEDAKAWKDTRKAFKVVYDSTLDGIALTYPNFKPFVPILKALFSLDDDQGPSNAEIMNRLDDLEDLVKDSEQHLKDHMYNVVAINQIGDKYNSVRDKGNTVRTLIGDIQRNPNLTEAQRTQQIADLYHNSEFQSLTSAMNGATDCFFSANNNIFQNVSIFDAAYNTACETVMFSGEALDVAMPYLVGQYAAYAAGYATMETVYDAYEAVYGAGSVDQSRELMTRRLFGRNLDGSSSGKAVSDLIGDFFRRDRFVFVNQSNNTNVPLSQSVCLVTDFAKECVNYEKHFNDFSKTPSYMSGMPLSQAQVKALASYCASRKTSVFDLLFNRVGFIPGENIVDPTNAMQEIASLEERIKSLEKELETVKAQYENLPPDSTSRMGYIKRINKLTENIYESKGRISILLDELNTKGYNWDSGAWVADRSIYLMGGAQNAEKHHPGGGTSYIDYKAVEATKVGASVETYRLIEVDTDSWGYQKNPRYHKRDMLFFLPR